MWSHKIIKSFNLGPDFEIESLNVGPLQQINSGPCVYKFRSQQLPMTILWIT
jgi:hypothetical protein